MANQPPSHHSNRWYRKHPEATRPLAEPTPAKTNAAKQTPSKPWWKRIAGPILAGLGSLTLTILDAKGYLTWVPDWLLAATWVVCLTYWAWAEGHLRSMYYKRRVATAIVVFVLVACISLGYGYRRALFRVVHMSKDAQFVPPSGHKAVKFEGNVNPNYRHCYGLSDKQEIECLCPRPVDYELVALPTPPDNNYATMVDIKAAKDAMYRVQLFSRTPMTSGKIEASPYGEGKAGIAVVEWQDDLYTLMIQSSAPQDLFKLEVKTSEGLRLKCINQIN